MQQIQILTDQGILARTRELAAPMVSVCIFLQMHTVWTRTGLTDRPAPKQKPPGHSSTEQLINHKSIHQAKADLLRPTVVWERPARGLGWV